MEVAAQRNFYLLLFAIGILPFFVNGVVNPFIFQRPALYWSFEITTWVLLPVLVFSLATRIGGLRLAELGLHARIRERRNAGLLLLLCVLAGPIFLFIYSNSLEFFRRFVPGEALFSYASVVPEQGLYRAIVALYLGVSAGVVEELYYRGFFFRISQLFHRPLAVYLVTSPVLFALTHWEGTPAGVPAAFVVGLFACLLFVTIRNLWPLMIGHVFTDYFWYQ